MTPTCRECGHDAPHLPHRDGEGHPHPSSVLACQDCPEGRCVHPAFRDWAPSVYEGAEERVLGGGWRVLLGPGDEPGRWIWEVLYGGEDGGRSLFRRGAYGEAAAKRDVQAWADQPRFVLDEPAARAMIGRALRRSVTGGFNPDDPEYLEIPAGWDPRPARHETWTADTLVDQAADLGLLTAGDYRMELLRVWDGEADRYGWIVCTVANRSRVCLVSSWMEEARDITPRRGAAAGMEILREAAVEGTRLLTAARDWPWTERTPR